MPEILLVVDLLLWLKPYPLQHKFLKYMHSWERWHISFFNRKSCTKSFFSTEKFVMIDCPSVPWKPKVWNKKAFKSFKGLLAQFSSVQPLSHVQLFATPRTAACQAFLSIANSQSLRKLMSIESVMPSNHLILCRPLLLLPSVFPSTRIFSNESALRIRWPKY